ncbi:TlpA family protein disulfide reductase [Nonomuraea rhizosphaerae]|uniref:TlpA family protein disulfide reductase n=1 Tax=Nonomuraea rhizosphaerae TaxID=2665663 RepID=UPI001C606B88|nr:hypothetical protein [Nonomuraea rhizosphaerae]
MDVVLIAAVVVVGVLGGLNLLLMLAVLRRLREYDEKWARAGADNLAERGLLPVKGTRVAGFTATTLDGAAIALREPAGVSGAGLSSAGVSGAGLSSAGVSGAGLSSAGVSGAGLSGVEVPLLVGFLSTGCPACHEELPRFVEYAGAVPGGREQNLVVISGSADEAADIIEAVSPVARVVVEPVEGPLMTAFGVRRWPLFVVLGQDGTVQAGTGGVAALARSQQAVPV